MAFTKEVNHGDYLVCEPILKYVEGGITLLSEIDIGKWSFFEFVGFLKQDVKIKGDLKLWWEGVDVGLQLKSSCDLFLFNRKEGTKMENIL